MVNIFNEESQHVQNGSRRRVRSSRRATAVVLLLLALHHLGFKIMYLPLNRLIENRFCLDYYRHNDPSQIPDDGRVPEKLCKVDTVQQQLAALFGTVESLHLFIDLAVAIPYGMLSDRGYRRLVTALNFVGLASMYAWLFGIGFFGQNLNPKLMLLGPIFSIVGGGECVFMSSISSMVTDIVQDSVGRTTVFAYVSSVTYITHAICPSLAGLTLSYNLWLPFVVGLIVLPLGAVMTTLLPNHSSKDAADHAEHEPLLVETFDDSERKAKTSSLLGEAHAKLLQLAGHIAGRRNFKILIGIFFVASFASSNSALLPQYISKRYNWTFAHSGYLLSVKAIVNITLLTLVVPTVVHLMASRFDYESGRISKLGAQVMFSISVIGVLLVAVAPSVPYLIFAFFMYALGSAIPAFTLSLVSHPSITRDATKANAMDYTVIMIGKFAGNASGLPTMTVLWAKAIGLGGLMLGLPYFTSGLVYSIGVLLVISLRLET